MTAAGQKQRIQKKRKLLRGGFDLPLFVLVMIILMLGLIMMFSASYADGYYNHHGDGFFYIKRQGLWAALGLVVMYIVAQMDYHWLRKFVLPVMGITYLLLVVVLFTHPINGVRRWIDAGPINIQPSEIAKFAVVLIFAHLIAKYSTKRENKMQTFKYGVAPFILILATIAGLMIKEPHLSGTILILSIGCTMMFVGGTRVRWFVIGISMAGGALLGMVLFTKIIVYAKNRLVYWIDPFKDPQHHGWQTIQSLYAIGSGGIMGLGLGNSRQKYLYVSEPQNDFVFPILCEELGLVGAVIVIVLFALLVWRGYVVAMRAPDRFGALMAVGLTTQVGLQAILNIAVTTNTIPNTGISLPFFSYGGSSLLMLLFQMGIILSISRFSSIEQT
ncbi:MAG: putative peptidoglycan glycosyltransferase FtsW [Ethanoligenens sp.]|uniref:FtsW/RodA/SpoVE family cell cycle protein n=1 Tax=Ethanoligenens sp. TaxID=2099655 RepID=UPI0039E7470E